MLYSNHKAGAQYRAFSDTWIWDDAANKRLERYQKAVGLPSHDVICGLYQIFGNSGMLAYLTYMAERLEQMHRLLKPTGSLYFHCDTTVSHGIKLVLDAIFGAKNFKNEIVWHYRKWSTGKYSFQRNHDVIFFYSRSINDTERIFNQLFMDRAKSTIKRFGKSKIHSGYDHDGRRIPSQMKEEESMGVRQDDVWDIGRVPPIKQLYPTQKPCSLLERIIKASSNQDDIVLDPFCGCGTTIDVANQLKRQWIGIDIFFLCY